MIIEVLIWAVRIFCVLVVILVSGAAITGARALLRSAPPGRHQAPAPPALPHRPRGGPDYDTGSMWLDEERDYLIRRDGVVYIDHGEVLLEPWGPPNHAGAGTDTGPKQGLWNGHTFGCTIPDENHPGACPEEGDDPDDPWRWPVPGLPPAAESPAAAAGSSVVDTAVALAADDPDNAGWTDQLLADLHDAPTVLDKTCGSCGGHHPPEWEFHGCGPQSERLADTGEITLAAQRADYAAELRAQDDETTEYLSRLNTTAAELRLQLHGL